MVRSAHPTKYKMAAQAGWDIYPIGSDARPGDMPKGTLAGIVIVQ